MLQVLQRVDIEHLLNRAVLGRCCGQPRPSLAASRAQEHYAARHPAGEGAGLGHERGPQLPVAYAARLALAFAVSEAEVPGRLSGAPEPEESGAGQRSFV